MSDQPSDLASWKDALEEKECKCPWPGPRPLQRDDPDAWLVGRHATRQDVRRLLSQCRLLLLHGPSGIGKTSLLHLGLIPDMDDAGSEIWFCDRWGGAVSPNVDVFLAEKLRLPVPNRQAFFDLNRTRGGRALIVLDQFEELIRYRPDTATAVIDFILELNKELAIKIVVCFRSEYLHELSRLTQDAVNFTSAELSLGDLDDEMAERVVLAGNKVVPNSVSSDAATTIAKEWVDARKTTRATASSDDPFRRIGLLHLQALLYSLHFGNNEKPLELEDVNRLIQAERVAAGLEGDAPDVDTFQLAMQKAIQLKLQHCADVTGQVSSGAVDESFAEGTRWTLARAVDHMSSAGYKVIRSGTELAQLSLGVDYDALSDALTVGHQPVSQVQERALLETMFTHAGVGAADDDVEAGEKADLLTVSRRALATAADAALDDEARRSGWRGISALSESDSWLHRLADADSSVFDNDPGEVTCGPMMGLAAADVLIEEYRRFAFALVWLEESSLVRITKPMGGVTMISLIHDGFGIALLRWAEEWGNRIEGPLNAITAPRGASFIWTAEHARLDDGREATLAPRAQDGEVRLLANLRWLGASIRADFDRVAFLNCDLRGAIFLGCRMRGVAFVNCLLDGVIFTDCLFVGAHEAVGDDDGWSDEEPVFVVSAPQQLGRLHARYRVGYEGTFDQTFLVCGLPGSPAVPLRGEPPLVTMKYNAKPVAPSVLGVTWLQGGMTIYGGRVSSLVLRQSHVAQGSCISFRHTTGTGLELVEISDPIDVEIHGSALRHLALSARVNRVERAVVHAMATDSALVQTWVGPKLDGQFIVRGSRLLQAWNESPLGENDKGVDFVIERDGAYQGLVGVRIAEGSDVGAAVDGEALIERGRVDLGDNLSDQLQRMDYRRNPARLAHELSR
jgi:hypothetical protein